MAFPLSFIRSPFLWLPLLSGIGCYFLSHQRRQLGGSNFKATGNHTPPENKLNAERSRLEGYMQRIAAAQNLEALTALRLEIQEHFPAHPLADWMQRQVLGRMISLDAQAGWAWVQAFPNHMGPSYDYLSEWGAVDRNAAAAAVLAGPKEEYSSLQLVARAWAKADPAGFLKEGIPANWQIASGFVSDYLQSDALASLAEKDLAQALSLANGMKADLYVTDELLAKFTTRMISERGVVAAVAWAQSLQDWPESLRQNLVANTLGELALQDPAQAATEYLKIATSRNSDTGARIAGLLAKQDPVAALNWARQLKNENAESARALVKIGEAIGPDALALLQVANGMVKDDKTPRALDAYNFLAVLAGQPTQEIARCTAELAAQPNSPQQQELVAASISHWAERDSAAAWAAIQAMPPTLAAGAREAFCQAIAIGRVTGVSAADQLKLIAQIAADPPSKSPFTQMRVQRLLSSVASTDPVGALAAYQANHRVGKEALEQIFSSLANQAPATTASRIETLPAEQQATATAGFVRGWAGYDPMAASVWARDLTPGPTRDAAASSLVHALQTKEPASAFSWAISVSDPAQQLPLLKNTIGTWTDAAAASAAIESSSLPDETKAERLPCKERNHAARMTYIGTKAFMQQQRPSYGNDEVTHWPHWPINHGRHGRHGKRGF